MTHFYFPWFLTHPQCCNPNALPRQGFADPSLPPVHSTAVLGLSSTPAFTRWFWNWLWHQCTAARVLSGKYPETDKGFPVGSANGRRMKLATTGIKAGRCKGSNNEIVLAASACTAVTGELLVALLICSLVQVTEHCLAHR